MARKLSAVLVVLIFSVSILQGCVPVYCAISNARAPESERLELFEWETGTRFSYQPRHTDLAIMQADQPGNWIVFNREYRDHLKTKLILVDDRGNYIETLPHRDMWQTKDYILFTDDPLAYENANISATIEESAYPQILEVEAWLRQTLGRLIAPLMGKSGRAFIYDSHSRFACCPPRVAVTTTHPDGIVSTQRYTLPHTEYEYWGQYGTLISEGGRFLYIYYYEQGAIIRLGSDE